MLKRILLLFVIGGAAVLPIMLTEQALHIDPTRRYAPDRARADDIAASTGSTWKDAEIAAFDGALLKGWVFTPTSERDSGKAVILLHGAGDSRRGMLGFTRFFVERGFTTLAVDSRGHGVSGGAAVTYGLLERQDVQRWAEYFLGLKPSAQLYGLGMSMGAAVLIQSLDVESRFRSIVAECPYSTFREAASERVPRLTGLPAPFASPILGAAFLYARTRYGFDLDAASPIESIKRARTPVLLIHGLADDRTAPLQSRRLYDANPRMAELWEVPGARHVRASETAKQEFEDRVLRWFQK